MDNNLIRINKFVAMHSDIARRKVDEYILQGRITINGISISQPGFKIDPQKDKVSIDGEPIKISTKKIYIILNKPINIISSVSDEKRRKTVVDIINIKERIFPIGRLDFDTTGLILLTNDGDFANKLMHPKFKVDKTYLIEISRPLEERHKIKLMNGIKIEGRRTSPCKIEFPRKNDFTYVSITLHEGRNRQVKNMFEHYGYFVRSLNRSEYGTLKLTGLKPGEWRYLTAKEIESLITD
ncbi:MAG: pseudouridine synthase [Ignavibacteria bacterium]|jgi:pseudouridine synthase